MVRGSYEALTRSDALEEALSRGEGFPTAVDVIRTAYYSVSNAQCRLPAHIARGLVQYDYETMKHIFQANFNEFETK